MTFSNKWKMFRFDVRFILFRKACKYEKRKYVKQNIISMYIICMFIILNKFNISMVSYSTQRMFSRSLRQGEFSLVGTGVGDSLSLVRNFMVLALFGFVRLRDFASVLKICLI